tara:strand:- start:674 stop:1828 length:1155 start_codon:yes stop_codon:yes gene_type:complete
MNNNNLFLKNNQITQNSNHQGNNNNNINYVQQYIPESTRGGGNNGVTPEKLDYNNIVNNLKQNNFVENIKLQPHPKILHEQDDKQKNTVSISDNNNYKKYESSYKISNNQIYTAEIGEKRKLSNIIYKGIISSLKISTNNISEYDIDILINKLNLVKGKWEKEETKKFVEELKKMISIKNIDPEFNQTNDLFERETKDKVYYISIDSNDRNMQKWPNPNNYQINFEPISISNSEEQSGFINKSFNNVKSVELIQAIIPIHSNNGDNYDLLPYILLEIEELGAVYEGTNDYTSKTFAKLIFDKIIGSYRYSSNNNSILKIFNPRIALNKFTVKFRKPNGELYNFGEYISNSNIEEMGKIKPNNILTFKITCIIKSLDTMYLDKKN